MHEENILVKHDNGTTQREIMDKVMPNDANTDTSIIDFSTPLRGEWFDTARKVPAAYDQYQGEKARTYNDSLKGVNNPYREAQHYTKKPEVETPDTNSFVAATKAVNPNRSNSAVDKDRDAIGSSNNGADNKAKKPQEGLMTAFKRLFKLA